MFNENTWRNGEDLAVKHLKRLGYKIVGKNVRVGYSEIDIVAIEKKRSQLKELKSELLSSLKTVEKPEIKKLLKQNFKKQKKTLADMLVIVEVKARINNKFGTGLEAVDLKKQAHIRRGTQVLLKQKQFLDMPVRFDVVSVDGKEVLHTKNAF